MNVSREQALEQLKLLVGAENVLTDQKSLELGDSMNRSYEKAFGLRQTPLAMAVVNVHTTEQVSAVLKYCNEQLIHVIPKTGGSAGEGLFEILHDDTIILDGSPMNQILKIDTENMMATCQCGVPLQELEDQVNKLGLTTGHSPQSRPMADMGGLVATRSIGQFSTYYGAIEDMICGMEAVRPNGEVNRIRNVPRRSAGPDLRHIYMGSEGAMGFITEITVKLFPFYPDDMWMGGYIMKDMMVGFDALRQIIVEGYKPSVVRLYDKEDMDYNFGSVKMKDNEAFMFFVAEGPRKLAQATGERIHEIAMEYGGEYIGTKAVEHWMIHRNDLCNHYTDSERYAKYRQTKILYSTTEISASWTDIKEIYRDVINNVPQKIDNLVMLGGHVSHSYINGTNIYFVYRLKMASPETSNDEHTAMVHAICEEVLKYESGGCVHHHGMGKKRVPMAWKEHGTSYPLMIDLKHMMDPNNIMNPGTLVMEKDIKKA